MYVGDVGGSPRTKRGDHLPAGRPEPRRQPRLELLLRDRRRVGLHPLQLLPAGLPVPERPRRRDRRIRGARPGAAVLRRQVPVRPLQQREHRVARPERRASRRTTPSSTCPPSPASVRTAWGTCTRVAHRCGLPARRERRQPSRETSIGVRPAGRGGRCPRVITNQLFIVEKPGRVQSRGLRPGRARCSTSASLVHGCADAEEGLLAWRCRRGLRHEPRRMFVFYVDNGGDLQVDEVPRRRAHASADNPARPGRQPQRRPAPVRARRRALPLNRATAAPRAIPRATPRTRTRCSARS